MTPKSSSLPGQGASPDVLLIDRSTVGLQRFMLAAAAVLALAPLFFTGRNGPIKPEFLIAWLIVLAVFCVIVLRVQSFTTRCDRQSGIISITATRLLGDTTRREIRASDVARITIQRVRSSERSGLDRFYPTLHLKSGDTVQLGQWNSGETARHDAHAMASHMGLTLEAGLEAPFGLS